MKRYLFCLFFLLLMVVPLMGVPYEQTEEYAQKQAILNERAARFKAETAFEGYITYNYQDMKFSHIIGNFRDIVITAPQDTVYMRQVFDQVLAKVKPYISAKEGQLFRGKISSNTYGTGVRYEQIVNGYRIEGGFGYLKMYYNFATFELSIVDDTADISSDIIPINISLNQAVQIAIQRYDPNYNYDPNNELTHPRSKLVYFPIPGENDSYQCKLCYMIAFWGLTVFIDPSSGDIIHTRTLIIKD